MRAVLKPKRQSPHAQHHAVTLLARTSNGKIVIERAGPTATLVYAVERFLLHAEGVPARRLTDAEFATLPWRGKGPDRERQAAGDLVGTEVQS